MKLSAALQLSLVISLAFGTACGASPLTKKEPAAGTTMSGTTVIMTPELQTADVRVKQAENQLELAKKQLAAAKSILRAAEADLKAARAEREALALRTQAQGMAEEAGMRPDNNRSLAQVDSAAMTATPAGTMPVKDAVAAPATAPALRTQEMEYTPPPAADVDGVSPQVELR